MLTLEQFYNKVGSNASDIVSRLGGDESIVKLFLSKFPADKSLETLRETLASGEVELAFRAAHTLKGLCANLGLQSLFEKASAITEMLRAGDAETAKIALPSLEREYSSTLEALNELGIGQH